MSKRRKKRDSVAVQEFRIGDPEPVLDNMLDYLGVFLSPWAGYYETPVSLIGLSRMRHANAQHGRCLNFKRNILSRFFQPDDAVSMQDFRCACYDHQCFGMGYFQIIRNSFNGIARLQHLPALNMRKKPDTEQGETQFCWLGPDKLAPVDFEPGEVVQTLEYDTVQQIYGIPDWLCSMQALLLNEEATLFRRKYYRNGCHIGYILYTTDPNLDVKTENMLKDKIREGKAAGNFRSLYINIPGGKEKAVQVIPVGDISQRDEFQRIKSISADDVIVGHGMQPALAGIRPEGNQSFGDIEKIVRVYIETDVKSMVQPFLNLNQELGVELFSFDFELPLMGGGSGGATPAAA